MPRTEPHPDRTRSHRAGRPVSTRRTAAAQRQRIRRRRGAVLALAVLVVGTVTARWVEDPRDVTVASAHLAAAESTSRRPATSAGSAPSGTAGSTRSFQTASGSTATPTAAATRGTAAAPTTATPPAAPVAPTTRAPAHADDESDGSAAPAPNAVTVTVPVAGGGTINAQAIPAGEVDGSGRTVRYSIEVEDELPVSAAEFAATVHAVLTDPRGWQTEDDVRFVPVAPEELSTGARVDVRVTLASPALTAKLCAPLDVTAQQVSCWNGDRAVLNLTRWMLGSTTYGTDLAHYRIYLISHEVGHGLGHGHVHCPGPGAPAPVMLQQTKSLEGCAASPWPTGT